MRKAYFALFVEARFLEVVRESVVVRMGFHTAMVNLLLVVHPGFEHDALCSIVR